jgi:hypothetical protein
MRSQAKLDRFKGKLVSRHDPRALITIRDEPVQKPKTARAQFTAKSVAQNARNPTRFSRSLIKSNMTRHERSFVSGKIKGLAQRTSMVDMAASFGPGPMSPTTSDFSTLKTGFTSLPAANRDQAKTLQIETLDVDGVGETISRVERMFNTFSAKSGYTARMTTA